MDAAELKSLELLADFLGQSFSLEAKREINGALAEIRRLQMAVALLQASNDAFARDPRLGCEHPDCGRYSS